MIKSTFSVIFLLSICACSSSFQQTIPSEQSGEIGEPNQCSDDQLQQYVHSIYDQIKSNWSVPPKSDGAECSVLITQDAAGEILSSSVRKCSGHLEFRKSIEAAMEKASPLPRSENPACFDRNLLLRFRPIDL